MRLWNQVVLGTAQGKLTTAWDEQTSITIRKGANFIVGFYLLIVNTKPTANEASCPMIRVNSSDLGISNMQVHGGLIGAEGMAAHQSGYVHKKFHSWSPAVTGQKLWFAELVFSIRGLVACTEGFDIGIQLITSDVRPTPELIANLKANACGVWNNGDLAIEAAGAGDSATPATWGTADADMIVVEAKARSLVGINYTIGLNAETAGVPLCDYCELVCSDIDNFSPQQHLVNFGSSGSLGTVIDSIKEVVSSYLAAIVFDGLPSNKVKIAVSDINSLTGLTAGDGMLGIVWK